LRRTQFFPINIVNFGHVNDCSFTGSEDDVPDGTVAMAPTSRDCVRLRNVPLLIGTT